MASIAKINDQYRVRFFIYLPNGHKKDRSRRCGKLKDAKDLKLEAEILEAKTKKEAYSEKDITRWIRLDLLSKQDAALLNVYPDGRKSLRQAADEYIASQDCSDKEKAERERRINRAVKILGEGRAVQEIRHFDGEDLKKELRKTFKAVTVNKHLQDVKRMFTLQLAERVIEYHPFGVLGGVKVPKSEKIDHVTLTQDQIKEVLAQAEISDKRDAGETPGNPPALDGQLTLFLLMFFGTGLRRKEAMAARLENIDWDQRCLLLEDTKTDEPRTVGLGKRLYNKLLPRKGQKDFILPRFFPNSVSRSIKRHFERCGIKGMRLHDTRHTYTTRLLDLGVKHHDAMGRTGHKDHRMLDHYTHPKFGEVFEDEFEFMED